MPVRVVDPVTYLVAAQWLPFSQSHLYMDSINKGRPDLRRGIGKKEHADVEIVSPAMA